MLSPADMLVVGVAALLFFGPDQLPKVARRAGQVVRDVQSTSASFIREMERAADEPEHRAPYVPPEPYAPDPPTVTIDHEPHASTNHEQETPNEASHATFDHEPHATPDHEPQTTFEHAPPEPIDEPRPQWPQMQKTAPPK